jgi:hypothetical protein
VSDCLHHIQRFVKLRPSRKPSSHFLPDELRYGSGARRTPLSDFFGVPPLGRVLGAKKRLDEPRYFRSSGDARSRDLDKSLT